jgi:hypothetical protein
MCSNCDKIHKASQRLLDAMNEEWDVRVTYRDGSHSWFIFKVGDAPTVPDVISLVEKELMEPVQALIITNCHGQAERRP